MGFFHTVWIRDDFILRRFMIFIDKYNLKICERLRFFRFPKMLDRQKRMRWGYLSVCFEISMRWKECWHQIRLFSYYWKYMLTRLKNRANFWFFDDTLIYLDWSFPILMIIYHSQSFCSHFTKNQNWIFLILLEMLNY